MKVIFNDKRKYTRVLDKVLLNYLPVDEETVNQSIESCSERYPFPYDPVLKLVDISAGGIAVHSYDRVDSGQTLLMEITFLPEKTTIQTFATVLRCIQSDSSFSVPIFELKIEFEGLPSSVREKIIHHVSSKVSENRSSVK